MRIQLIKSWIVLFLFLGMVIFPLPHAVSAAEINNPGQIDAKPSSLDAHKDKSAGNMGAWMATLFRDYLSRVDGDRCTLLLILQRPGL